MAASLADPRRAAEAAARRSYGKLVALLAARGRDIAAAEDALAEAFAAALSDWPKSGVPDSPEAWLLAVARRRLIDGARRRKTRDEASDHLVLLMQEAGDDQEADIPDRRLWLMFACAHPALDPSIRSALILQTLLGFDAVAIGSVFLVQPATMGQRLVRAKQKIAQAGIPFELPQKEDLPERLDAVLEAVYSAFARGWSDPTGAHARISELAAEGIWLGRLIGDLMPGEPEALGLLALMLHLEARRGARRSTDGDYVALSAQDTALWDHVLIDEAEALLHRAAKMARPGRYQTEAAIQSAHAARRLTGKTDWQAIAALYDVLWAMTGSPVVAINRAMAQAETSGPAVALAELDTLATDARLATYQPYWAGRADLCQRVGDQAAARDAYGRAIGLEHDPAVRRFLQDRLAKLAVN
ncbi:MAG: RNA polymerase subunit sigma-70 [Rhizobiales bacterium 62-17]|nr:MAG: RNA polymerase subunit sigma-70 [Rhizobiales bacterium 62-17]